MNNFEIFVETQDYVEDYLTGSSFSTGQIYLQVDQKIITSIRTDEDWSISDTALALLRTLSTDWSVSSDQSSEWLIISRSKPGSLVKEIGGIRWIVRHSEKKVILSGFEKVLGNDVYHFSDIEVTLDLKDYALQIYNFGNAVRTYFEEIRKKDPKATLPSNVFWGELIDLLGAAKEQAGIQEVSHSSFIPYEHFTLEFDLSPDEMLDRLYRKTKHQTEYSLSKPYLDSYWESDIEGNRFKIAKVSTRKSRWINGEVSATKTGSKIECVVKMSTVEVIFWALVLIVVISPLVIVTVHGFLLMSILPIIFALFGYSFVTFSVKVHGEEARKFLKHLATVKLDD